MGVGEGEHILSLLLINLEVSVTDVSFTWCDPSSWQVEVRFEYFFQNLSICVLFWRNKKSFMFGTKWGWTILVSHFSIWFINDESTRLWSRSIAIFLQRHWLAVPQTCWRSVYCVLRVSLELTSLWATLSVLAFLSAMVGLMLRSLRSKKIWSGWCQEGWLEWPGESVLFFLMVSRP